MNKIKLYLALFILSISSFFNVKNIYCIFTSITEPEVNAVTIKQTTSYTVVHETMDLNGTTYTEHSHIDHSNVQVGAQVTPPVLTNLEGFNIPQTQTVTLDFDNNIITYRYTRKQYTLTINNSNYVTTSTPSGTYYYGQPITLTAAATDNNGNPFVKWSDNTTNLNKSFTLTGDTTIGPIYSQTYTITYEPNNGDSQIIDNISENESLGSLPVVTNDDCVGSTGDYQTRQCTEVYKFEGWYTENTYQNQVNENYIPTGDITLYAKWNKIYYAKDSITCDGATIEHTGVNMFDQLNADKDFIVKFTVDSNSGWTNTNGGDNKGTIFTDMNETGDPWPGVHVYTDSNPYKYTMNANKPGSKFKDTDTGYVLGQEITIKKEQGIVYYKYGNGSFIQINDFNNYTAYYDADATFCAGVKANRTAYRFFIGTLSNLSVELIDTPAYTIHFNSNGGTGMMLDQKVKLGQNTTINSNAYTNGEASFTGWNTQADGSGTSYSNNYAITSDLGNDGDVITLYAQWHFPEYFYVHFDANGGTGTMANQKFTIGDSAKPLTQNAFTRTGYEFRGWNTAADGTGTHYDDEQAVRDLSNVNNDIVTLYAQWMRIAYSRSGNVVFDGTANTFIDTGVNMFNLDPNNYTYDTDFEIRFTFVSVDSDQMQVTPAQPTIFNVKDESNQYMPGFNLRFNEKNKVNNMTPTYKWAGNKGNSTNLSNINVNNAPVSFVYKRVNGIVTMQYTYGNTTSQVYTLINQNTGWHLNQSFATNIAFGGYFDSNNQPGRFFKGTLAHIIVLVDD